LNLSKIAERVKEAVNVDGRQAAGPDIF